MTLKFDRHRSSLFAVVALLLLMHSGCGDDGVRANGDTTPEPSGPKSVEALLDELADESPSVRRQAQQDLSAKLKRKIYFDPAASPEQRSRQLVSVRRTWENLQKRDLVEAVKQRLPTKYFYDLNTGEVFEDLASKIGPFPTDSGPHEGMPAGVRAVVLSCTSCEDEDARYVGWVEAPLDGLEQYGVSYQRTGAGSQAALMAIRKPDRGQWAQLGSEEADAVMLAARRCDDDGMMKLCRPGK